MEMPNSESGRLFVGLWRPPTDWPIPHALVQVFLGALTIIFFAGYRYFEPPWVQDQSVLKLVFGLAVAYSLALLLVRSDFMATTAFTRRVVRIIAFGSLFLFPVFGAAMLDKLVVRQLTLVFAVSLTLGLLLVNSGLLSNRLSTATTIIAFLLAIAPSANQQAWVSLADIGQEESPDRFLFSSLHDLRVIESEITHRQDVSGGAIEPLGSSRLFLINGFGDLSLLALEAGKVTVTETWPSNLPLNRHEYVEDVEASLPWIRVTDALLGDTTTPDQKTLLVSHHRWDRKNQCLTLNLSEGRLDLTNPGVPLEWETRFVSDPCLPPETLTNETGGRLAWKDPSSVLMTVGITVYADEYHHLAQEPSASYGKLIEIDTSTWESRVFTSGHRNPQGLLVDEGTIWLTEHGPEGGDELNLILAGQNYGWPLSSYGTEYGLKTLKGSDSPGDHSVGLRPIFSWVPSIGISQLVKVKGDAFPQWRGDFLISSLGGRGYGKSIYRLRVLDDKVQFVERIQLGFQIRDLVELPNGNLVTWSGDGLIQTVAPATHVFSSCIGCHSLNPGWLHGIGPDLLGVVNSPVARFDNYQYSDAMADAGGRWSRERLDAFLSDPQAVVPGTTMVFEGIKDKSERQEIIKYLMQVSRDLN